MKKIIFLSLLCCLSFGSEILLDKFDEARSREYRLEIRQKQKVNKKIVIYMCLRKNIKTIAFAVLLIWSPQMHIFKVDT